MKQLFLILLFVPLPCLSQVKVSLSKLSGSKWINVNTEESCQIIGFSNFAMTVCNSYGAAGSVSHSWQFYLCDSIPNSFDKSQVGKNTRGNFIIYYNSKSAKLEYRKITTLTSDSLVLYHKGRSNSIGAGEDAFSRYKLLKNY